jgi:hypothetical protein
MRGVDPRTTDIFSLVELQDDGEETLRVRHCQLEVVWTFC